MDDRREERARKRRNWPGGLVAEQTPAQLATKEERLASMWQLALDAWSATGRALPNYTRSTMPGRVIRCGRPRDLADVAMLDEQAKE